MKRKPAPQPLPDVQRAKTRLAEDLAGKSWFKGIGIAPSKQDDRFALRLTVDPDAKNDPEIPREFEGVPIEVVYLASYSPRAARES